MTYSWIATSSYNTALQRMSYFVLAKTIGRFFIMDILEAIFVLAGKDVGNG